MEKENLDPQLKEFLSIFNLHDDLILSIRNQIVNQIVEGLNNKQKIYFNDNILSNPKILMAYLYLYTPVENIDLRMELLKTMFPRYGMGPERWGKEKTFIIKEYANEFEHGSHILNEEIDNLKNEITKICESLSGSENPIKVKLNDLLNQFDVVLYADLIKINESLTDLKPDFKGKTIEEIRQTIQSHTPSFFNPFNDYPRGILTDSKGKKTLWIDFPEKMSFKEVTKEIEKWEWWLIEWLTKNYQFFQSNQNLRNIIFFNPHEIVMRHKGEIIQIFPMGLFQKEFPVFYSYLENILKQKNISELRVKEKDKHEEDRRRIIETKIQEAIHKASMKFKPGGFREIQGYYKKMAEYEGKSLSSKYNKKFSKEMMDRINIDEFKGLWNDHREEIKHELGFEKLEKCVNRVIDEKYFDPKLVKLVQGTPLERYVDFLEIDTVSIDSYYSKEDEIEKLDIPRVFWNESLNPEETLSQSQEEEIDKKKIEALYKKVRTPRVKKILDMVKEGETYEEIGRKFNMTRQGISQLLKRLGKNL
jgi:hypothetical protein